MSRKNSILALAIIFLLLNLIYFTETIPKSSVVYHKVKVALIGGEPVDRKAHDSLAGTPNGVKAPEEVSLKVGKEGYHPRPYGENKGSSGTGGEAASNAVVEEIVGEVKEKEEFVGAPPVVPAGSNTQDKEISGGQDGLSVIPKPGSVASEVRPVTEDIPASDEVGKDTTTILPLTKLCEDTKWTPGLWLHCHSGCGVNSTSICGGLNNARNRLQTCLRLAIDAGAGLILPSATTRNEKKLVEVGAETVCTETFWDVESLKQSLSTQCKQLKIRGCDDRSGIPESRVIDLKTRIYTEPSFQKGTFLSHLQVGLEEAHLGHKVIRKNRITAKNPAIVSFRDSYIAWDYQKSGELDTIRKDLFKILKFNAQLLDLSKQIMASPELEGGEFIGVHLRGESDWPAGFGTVQDQMRLYIADIQRINQAIRKSNSGAKEVKSIYVSCGSQEAIQVFREKLDMLGYVVYDKWTLLAGEGKEALLEEVEELHFDQKAIVEYQTLVGAKYWLGIISSTMSCLIAYARTVDGESGLLGIEPAVEVKPADVDLDDGLAANFFEKFIFPGTTRKPGGRRTYPKGMEIRGSEGTRLIVLTGRDVMRNFP